MSRRYWHTADQASPGARKISTVSRVRPVPTSLFTTSAQPASSSKTAAAIRLGLPAQRRARA